MPNKKTYNEKWEDKEDITGNKIGLWCKRENDQTARCSFCYKIISVSTHGIAVLRIHAKQKNIRTIFQIILNLLPL